MNQYLEDQIQFNFKKLINIQITYTNEKDKMEKSQVPQITPNTGVSGDYSNELMMLLNVVESYKKSGKDIFYKIKPLKKYEERYPSDKYQNIITDQNRVTVKKIDDLTDKINNMLKTKSRDLKWYLDSIYQMKDLIYGKE